MLDLKEEEVKVITLKEKSSAAAETSAFSNASKAAANTLKHSTMQCLPTTM